METLATQGQDTSTRVISILDSFTESKKFGMEEKANRELELAATIILDLLDRSERHLDEAIPKYNMVVLNLQDVHTNLTTFRLVFSSSFENYNRSPKSDCARF